jgi:5-formyltetrahydrofolate cyclo-ligase
MSNDLQIESRKRKLRAKARATRDALSTAERAEAAERVARIGLGFLGVRPSLVAAYHPVRSEFDCLPLLARLAGDGWKLALPVIAGPAPLDFRQWSFGDPLTTGAFGIAEPIDAPRVSPGILLVPLLAFDARRYRLGYGGGHYDRTLTAFRAKGDVTAIGLAFDEQRVPDVPVGAYDQQLDWILTPSGPLGP